MAITMSDAEARSRIGAVLRQVAETREPVIVEWDGMTRVAIVPIEAVDEAEKRRTELRDWFQEADRIAAKIEASLGDRTLPDIDELIDGGRDERDDAIIAGLH